MTAGVDEHATAAPTDVVLRFLEFLGAADVDRAAELLSPAVHYINVPLPAIRGRQNVCRVLRSALAVPGAGFEAYLLAVASTGQTVLTERVDVMSYGPVRIQFWVCGRFDVDDGKIVLWWDYFDWWNFTIAALRGLLGAVLAPLRPKRPVARSWQRSQVEDSGSARRRGASPCPQVRRTIAPGLGRSDEPFDSTCRSQP